MKKTWRTQVNRTEKTNRRSRNKHEYECEDQFPPQRRIHSDRLL